MDQLSSLGRNRKTKNGAKFLILFWAGLCSSKDFNFSFRLDRARTEICIFTSGQAGPRLLPCRPLPQTGVLKYD